MGSDHTKNGDFGDWLDGDTNDFNDALEGVDLDSFGEDFEDASLVSEENNPFLSSNVSIFSEATNPVRSADDAKINKDRSFSELASKRMGSVLFPDLIPQWENPSLGDGVDDNPLANEVYRVDALLEQMDLEESLDDFVDLPEEDFDDFEDLPEEDFEPVSPIVDSKPVSSVEPAFPIVDSISDFTPLGSAIQEDDTDLSLEVLEQVESVPVHDQIEYPCMVIDGLTTVEEAQFLHRLKPNSEMVLPLYCSIDGTIKRIGTSELTIKYLQILNYLGDYGVSIMKSKGVMSSLDLKDVNTYLGLVTL